MPKLRSFLALDGSDRRASVEAMIALATAAVLVRFVQPRHWWTRFGIASRDSGTTPAPDRIATIRRVRLAVARAQRNVPTAPNCLPQALAARWMLKRRGIPSALFLGTQRSENDHRLLRFHAWLKVGPEWVTGHCDESHYSLMVPQGSELA